MSVDNKQYLETQKRNFCTSENGYIRERLINIDTDHIIPDELHLLLRITDRMIENLINGAVAHDHVSNILDGPMIKQLIQTINSCGVIFNIYVTNKSKREFTSLTGTDRRKLLRLLPSKLIQCQPSHFAEKVKSLWEVRKYQIVTLI